jgi:hypothetical protein
LVRDGVVRGAAKERESGVSIRWQSGDLDGTRDELIRIRGNGKVSPIRDSGDGLEGQEIEGGQQERGDEK